MQETQPLTPMRQYELSVMLKRHSPYMDYPEHVHMETFAQCNAACNFCPYPTLERKGERMEDALIEKIISDLKDIPRNVPFQISPFKVSEPFLDKRLFDILKKINLSIPQARIALTSNASPITEETLLKLNAINNFVYLWISFNDHREKEYEATMQLSYARTIERLNVIHRFRVSRQFPGPVVLSRVGDGTAADQEFCNWVKAHYPAFEFFIFPRTDWLKSVDTPAWPVPNAPCARWFELSITATGVVAHCCADGQAKFPIGNVRDQHALDIYNAPHYRQLRERTVSRLHVDPCKGCSFM